MNDDAEFRQIADAAFDLARTGETARLLRFVDSGLPVDLVNGSGDSLLMLAAYHGHADTVRALIGRGADVERRNDRGQSPLAGAVFKDFGEVVTVLLAAGADPDAGTPSARQIAAMFDRDSFGALDGAHALGQAPPGVEVGQVRFEGPGERFGGLGQGCVGA
ncbi:ankyrin repeat domain-containing protein [Glycomyces sp. L485]|nr:ankyrin repeat domain-containing protein [Glycomyces sp. L485]MCH7230315.1 ankyrin repeat domain-containing protein [Glycomyces sp. L485]